MWNFCRQLATLGHRPLNTNADSFPWETKVTTVGSWCQCSGGASVPQSSPTLWWMLFVSGRHPAWVPPLMPCAQFQCLVPSWRLREKQKMKDTPSYTFAWTCSDLILHRGGLFCMRSVNLLGVLSYSHPQAELLAWIMVPMAISSGGMAGMPLKGSEPCLSSHPERVEWHWEDDNSLVPTIILSTSSNAGRSLSSRAWSLVITSRFYGLSSTPNSHLSNAAWLLIPSLMC